ncbi:MAG: type I-C CRISPR-associated protein Cas8c/Csd1 [Deltaproteobacteria bacterium]|nr:type I-C CRISPR-associated protein Cas8c/Csd1 [Deltaproteobacteria bacterium]
MIKELSELGKSLRVQKSEDVWVHDALKEEVVSLVLTIKSDGSFSSLQPIERKKTTAEAVQRTSGKGARLLMDNSGYVLGVYDPDSTAFKKKAKEKGVLQAKGVFIKDVSDKNKLFIERLDELKELDELIPVVRFYGENKENGIDLVGQEYFLNNISKKDRSGNIAILVSGNDKYIHENEAVYKKVIEVYDNKQKKLLSGAETKCSICAKNDFPIGDFTHFPIKGVPGDKEPAGGRKLISYNDTAFESYTLQGNENSSICTNCAKTYVEGLNWLLSAGNEIVTKTKKGKDKTSYRYTNRRNFGSDTAIVFWTRENRGLPEIDQLEAPNPNDVNKLLSSVSLGKEKDSRYVEADQFYSCTLSGSAARIAVRDWIETSLFDFRQSIAQWFKDIAVTEYDSDLKTLKTRYAGLYNLARSSQNTTNDKDVSLSRTAAYLWNAAIKETAPPLWLLTKVLQRARMDEYGVTAERASLIKLILNRNNKGGGFMVTEKIEDGFKPVAYICGQIFAKLESIQYAALGDRNAGIRERYFTYAMTLPAAAFGRLFNLHSKHFTKLKNEKPGLAINMDKELQELCKDVDIKSFPATFSLEEQGQFAIGYYHQRQKQFNTSNQN